MNLELPIQIAGLLHLLLAVAHVFMPKRFGWKEELARLSLLNRQIFLVHCLFIVVVLVLFGVLSLGFTALLLAPGPLARVVLSGLVFFWALRLLAQWFIYDARLWRGDPFNTAMHFLFTGLWIYHVAVYGLALRQQFPTS